MTQNFEDYLDLSKQLSGRISLEHTHAIAATLGNSTDDLKDSTALPPLWHWCFLHETVPTSQLGEDGHPLRGDFLPDADLPRRMWAGSRLQFKQDLIIGKLTDKTSRIRDIKEKQGKSGRLLFVCVEHQLSQDGKLCIHEEQDLVFREAASQPSNKEQVIQATPAATEAEPSERQDFSHTVIPSTTLLFRYSALTFNTHRIHYDHIYATETEAYSGLVVHGPLQATLLLNLAADALKTSPNRFSFRGLAPLTLPCELQLHSLKTDAGGTVWCQDQTGLRSFSADFSDM